MSAFTNGEFLVAHISEFCKHQVHGTRVWNAGNYNLTETSHNKLRTITPGILIIHAIY